MSYAVRRIAREDMEAIRVWRNAQMPVLRQAEEISPEQQQRYFEQAIEPTFSQQEPRQVLVTLLEDDEPIGYGGLTNLDWSKGEGELSFLVAPERAGDPETYERDFRAFLALVVDGVALTDLGLRRVFTETYDIRPHHVAILEGFGFAREGRLEARTTIDGRDVDSLMHGYVGR
ncbi:GNAT family N-acetyltransferase [Solirubrobacter soli]|uniref:GNAT family N-acetyltransferase n=1 Tax=Solirubrobacter soli TaxID=363832 RepID=UPI00041E9D47|nr:GNAT family N-acetyltransferase [Solirubrobacter soli]